MSIAFFGATGGTTNAALVLALKAGLQCRALARTPQKLIDMLQAGGVEQSSIDAHLHIVQGAIQDVDAVRDVLFLPGGSNQMVQTIVSGLGVYEIFKPISVCREGATAVIDALDTHAPSGAKRPHFIAISTTGITSGPRDVPLLMVPLYHVLLAKPHVDKHEMERRIVEAAKANKLSGFTFVRPSLLWDGQEYGMSAIRAGTEPQPAVGYYINRVDVGRWIFEELLKDRAERWTDQKVSITY